MAETPKTSRSVEAIKAIGFDAWASPGFRGFAKQHPAITWRDSAIMVGTKAAYGVALVASMISYTTGIYGFVTSGPEADFKLYIENPEALAKMQAERAIIRKSRISCDFSPPSQT